MIKQTALLTLSLFLCVSCSIKTRHLNISEGAYIHLAEIVETQGQKSAEKGIAYISISNKNKKLASKAAFISNSIDSIRLEFLSPAGLPFLRISYNGKETYLKEDGKTKRFSNTKKILKHITGIDIPPEFLAELICGSTPLIDFDSAYTDNSWLVLENENETARYKKNPNGLKIDYKKKGEDSNLLISLNVNGFLVKSTISGFSIEFTKELSIPLKKIGDTKIFIID